jgi:hypothetical protein
MSDQGDTDRSFNQEAVDKIVQERLARERGKHEQAALERAEEHKSKVSELEAQLHETNARLTETSSRAQQAQISEAIARVSVDRGIRDIDAAAKLLNPDLVEVTDAGVNVEVAVDALLEQKPYLREPISGSADQGARGGTSRQITEADLQHMSTEEYAAAKAAGRLDHFFAR